jgi:adenylylsulfate kinase
VTGAVVWMTGLPASGKSTLARGLAQRLRDAGREPLLLDGDELRDVMVPAPGHDEAGRDAFYRTLGQLAALVARQGLIAIVAATAHRRRWRDLARAASPRFIEVHVATPLEECRRRDPKGLYRRSDVADALPGVGQPYEPPEAAEVVAASGLEPGALDAILALLESSAAPSAAADAERGLTPRLLSSGA